MALTEIQQLQQLLEQKKHILITFRKNGTGDAIAAAVALALFIRQLDKHADIVVDNFSLPRNFQFLKLAKNIKPAFHDLQKFVISVDVAKTGVKELSYDTKNNTLRIFITPKKGFLTRENVKTAQSDFRYDLILIVDTPDLESLGNVYTNNTELFYKTPIVNIDHHAENEQFGQVNITDMTVTATTEVLFHVLKKLGDAYLTPKLATALLAGIIANTRSFKTEHIKPQTLHTASSLIAIGADREYIVQNLYRTRTIASLKLWGETLRRLQYDNTTGLVWSTLTHDDFIRSGGNENDLYEIIDELITNSPEAKIIVLIHEHATVDNEISIHVLVHVTKNFNAKKLLAQFKPKGDTVQASCIINNKNLKETEELIVTELKTQLKNK